MSKFSESIKKYRKVKNLTQNQLAQKIFVTKQAISKWETGRGYPDTSTLPAIANVLDISIDVLMGEEEFDKKKSNMKLILLSVSISIVVLVLIFIVIISMINENGNSQSIKTIEQQIDYDLPNDGTFVTNDFENWTDYGNNISISKMSYIIFTKDKEALSFEDSIENNGTWIKDVTENLLFLIPLEIESYTTIGDYYMLCNISSKTYNELPVNSDSYDYIFLAYQKDNKRLIIFEYSIQYYGGNNEK